MYEADFVLGDGVRWTYGFAHGGSRRSGSTPTPRAAVRCGSTGTPAARRPSTSPATGSTIAVRLVAGRLRLDRTAAADPELARRALADWYSRAGQRWMRERLQPWAARMDVPEPAVRVRDLGHRWGSYRAGAGDGDEGMISLHWAVFQLPIHLVDYVVAHELAQVRVAGHGPEYWRLLGRALPECRRLKTELDELGRRVWMRDLA
ncbi:M48 family metallopeptidase [Streptomyces sp. SR-10]|uniref:M48 family metallopeptidase n=1 Tax=Streptomyces sp. SR-10 TaxID=3416442 RepID=UPI003CE8A300